MAQIELQENVSYQKNSFAPIELSDGTVVTMESIIDGPKKTMYGEARKDDKQVGMFRVNPDGDRLFIQVQPLESVSKEVAQEIVEAFYEGIKHLFKD